MTRQTVSATETRRGQHLLPGYIAILALIFAWQMLPASEALSGKLFDQQTRLLRAVRAAPLDEDVVVIGLDEQTLGAYPEPLTLWHAYFGELFTLLGELRCKLIVWDIVLPEKSFAFLSPGYDRALLSGIIAARRETGVVIAQTLDRAGRVRKLFPPIVSLVGAESIGLALVPSDGDGTVRRIDATLGGGAATIFGRALQKLDVQRTDAYINYTIGERIGYLPMHEVLAAHRAGDTGGLAAQVAGKVVLVGALLPFEDRHSVPLALAAAEPESRYLPGVMIQAQAIRSALNRALITPAAPGALLALVAGTSLLWWYRYDLGTAVAAILIGVGLLYVAALYAFAHHVYLPLGAPAGALLIAVTGRFGVEAGLAFRERRRYKASFARYVSPDVMREILAGRIKPDMQPRRRRACVLFSDIRSFTSRSESQPPEDIVDLLNEYFEEMVAAVHAHGGTVDKFIGDGLMAFFGAPLERDNPAADAFGAGRQMLQRLDGLNRRLAARGAEPVAIGIGLHLGDVVLGHVGARNRHEYTAIGDTVNTASRLEGLTKSLNYPLVCSAEVARLVNAGGALTGLGEQAVKGRAPIAVFGWRPTPTASGGV